jgi:hypothetical protein
MVEVLFKTSYAGSTVTIYENRLEWKMLFKKQSILLSQIASIDTTIPMYAGVVIETTGGKKYKIPVMFTQKKNLEEAIYQAQAGGGSPKQGGQNIGDLEKLAELRDKKIITEEEFNAKKKEILSL